MLAPYKYRVLSTKRIDAALLQAAADNGILIIPRAFISVDYKDTPELRSRLATLLPRRISAVFTSANAVKAVAALGDTTTATWDLYCLPGATIDAVQEYFPNSRVIAHAPSSAVLATILLQKEATDIVFFCGNIRRDELPTLLTQHQQPFEEVTVYETTELQNTVIGQYDGILFYSPSGIRSYFTANTPAPEVICFAIGDTTAGVLREYTKNTIVVSKAATADGLVNTAIHYFNNQS
ncbi:uroporphyrinogen-III synthase [Chitinophaga horti]|uniref:Uroporphyrinogen-III synthase n=1 Tax=Chitinophaga horti TaxID=2920382 RepID=A0ABY6J318_9BACT|nr:uroporphyrinogen-III synthase [Chitinophaga horti]UYQ93973.1 uroporphyrinogen-III synthase [Chitinophaga horti]